MSITLSEIRELLRRMFHVDAVEPDRPVDGTVWTDPATGVAKVWDADGDAWVEIVGTVYTPPTVYGYRVGAPIYYTASGSFVKASYPGLAAVIVECQGGGGGSGGAATTAAGQVAIGGPGNAGGYARSLVLASDLAASEAVTVGGGGAAGTAGANNGGAGADSIFDTIAAEVRGVGGAGGLGGATGAPLSGVPGGPATDVLAGGTGDLVVQGAGGVSGFALASNRIYLPVGGRSVLSPGAATRGVSGGAIVGLVGQVYGGGARGGATAASAAVAGNLGGAGIVIATPLYT